MSLTPSQIQILKDNASLILAPSAPYGVGGFQAIKPFTEAGRFDFSRTTGKYVEKTGGLTWVDANVPAFDLNGALVNEPARTNLLLRSQQFSTAPWVLSKSGTGLFPVLLSSSELDPFGDNLACKYFFDTGGGISSNDWSAIRQAVSVAANTYTSSFYAKGEVGGEQILFRHVGGVLYKTVTLSTEWQRFTTTETGNTSDFSLEIRQGISGIGTINQTATIYFSGGQFELGAYATSPIPTAGATATRTADIPTSQSKQQSLINSQEGFLFAEVSTPDLSSANKGILCLSDGGINNRIFLAFIGTGNIRFFIAVGGVLQAYPTGVPYIKDHIYKFCFTYKLNEFILYIDGVPTISVLSGNVPAANSMNSVSFNLANPFTDYLIGSLYAAAIGTTALSEADAIALTT